MQTSNWHTDLPSTDDDESCAPRPAPPEALADRLGTWVAFGISCVGLLIWAAWQFTQPSFEKCSGIENQSERYACYEKVRNELSKPPAKGAIAPLTFRGAGGG